MLLDSEVVCVLGEYLYYVHILKISMFNNFPTSLANAHNQLVQLIFGYCRRRVEE